MGAAAIELKKGLSQRHLTMIAMGGVIGAGLFVGSGVVISKTGPPAFISYALSGFLVIMVMRMLGEMAVANPSTGSFADYARAAMGGWAGFSVGWLYWRLVVGGTARRRLERRRPARRRHQQRAAEQAVPRLSRLQDRAQLPRSRVSHAPRTHDAGMTRPNGR
jgi:ABC-type xylose transport system permease subunit